VSHLTSELRLDVSEQRATRMQNPALDLSPSAVAIEEPCKQPPIFGPDHFGTSFASRCGIRNRQIKSMAQRIGKRVGFRDKISPPVVFRRLHGRGLAE